MNINREDFERHIDLFSADLSRWPKDLVKPALALMDADARAKALFDEALALDAKLRLYAPPQADLAALESRILRAVRRNDSLSGKILPGKTTPFSRALLFLPAPGLIAAAVLGFFIGFQAPQDASAFFYAPDQVIAGDDISFTQEGLF